MTGVLVGGLGLLGVLGLLFLGVPVAVSLGVTSIVGITALLGWGPATRLLETTPFEFAASWTLTAIPLFLFMSAIIHHSGIASALYRAARLWLAFLPGGLAVATNVAAAGFAATSGSSMATAAAMARLSVPEMLRYGYDKGLAAGAVTSAGTLGALIPPSVMMIVYAMFAEVSISRMLIAGILPGLLTAAVYTAMIVIRCSLKPSLAPRTEIEATWRERFLVLREIWPLPLLVVGILVGIYTGFVSASEAAALGSVLALLIALAMRRLTWQVLRDAIIEALTGTAQIFFIAIGAILLTRFLVLSGLPVYLADVFENLAVSEFAFLIGMSLFFVLLGMFLDPLGVMLIALPILLPIIDVMNLDLIWIGVLVVKYVEIGLLTPPVGMQAFVVHGIVGKDINLGTIFRGLSWFLLCEVVIMIMLIAFPPISTSLPSAMFAH